MNLADAPIAALVEASTTKVCGRCGERKTLAAFSPDATRADGRATACKPCRAAQVARARAAAEADRAVPAPKPTGRGPERLEPGAILVALEELGASDGPLVVLDVDMADVPRELRVHAVRGVDGRLLLPRHVLVDWVRSLRKRVGEHRMSARPQDLSWNARVVDTDNVWWARRRQQRSDD